MITRELSTDGLRPALGYLPKETMKIKRRKLKTFNIEKVDNGFVVDVAVETAGDWQTQNIREIVPDVVAVINKLYSALGQDAANEAEVQQEKGSAAEKELISLL